LEPQTTRFFPGVRSLVHYSPEIAFPNTKE